MSKDVEEKEEIRMKAVDATDPDPEVCCEVRASQIGWEWAYCPYCGEPYDVANRRMQG